MRIVWLQRDNVPKTWKLFITWSIQKSSIAAVSSPGNEGKTAVTYIKKNSLCSQQSYSGSHSSLTITEAAIPKPILFVVHVKYIQFEFSLFWKTFCEDELDKNAPQKPTVQSKALSASQNRHRVTLTWS